MQCTQHVSDFPCYRLLTPLALAATLLLPTPAFSSHAFPPASCQNDIVGANDEPGQKDLTQWCTELGDGAPYDIHTSANWDETTLTGNNTADVCSLFDTDADGFANLAVCVTLQSSGSGNGDLAVFGHLHLYTCGDTRTDRCTNHVHVNRCTGGSSCTSTADCPVGETCSGVYATTCSAAQEQTDPFSPAAVDGPGDEFPYDTEITCSVDFNDFGTAGSGALLLDVCSYPSTIPNSDPSDCIRGHGCQTAADCDDDNVCTTEACVSNSCFYTPAPGTPCTDGLYCNGDEICNTLGVCEPDQARNCDDEIACTIDDCDELGDTCTHDPRNSLCADDAYCNGVETCNPQVGCQAGTPPNCSDSVDCTVDTCNEATDDCEHSASDAACDDGQHCNGVETCDVTTGCQAGTAPDCNDGVACTTDACNESTDQCDHVADDAICSNGQYCDGAEICDPESGCQAGTPPDCDDTVDCTVDSCNEAIDDCQHDPDNDVCSDDLFCTGVEVCDPTDGCQPGTDPCPLIMCNEDTDACVDCMTDANCNNGVFCDGAETCNTQTGECAAGTPPSCADTVGCTVDICDEGTDSCVHSPYDALCDDGEYCNGVETCDALQDCQAGDEPDCSDAGACTIDTCDEANDRCVHTPNDAACNDGDYCNGTETCSSVGNCIAGTTVQCPADGFDCSIDDCDEATDQCTHDFSPCVCGDEETTGEEECDPPTTAGTFEDCNNLVDDDGDGKVDCRDRDCAPGAREPLCDEDCTLDVVCEKFVKDPAIIRYSWSQKHDFLSIHGRFPLKNNPDPVRDGLVFELSNEHGVVYRAFLDVGELRSNAAGTRYGFKDKSARLLGPESPSGGLYRVGLVRRDEQGIPYMRFRIRAYGDFGAATRVSMVTQLAVGTASGSLAADWTPKRRGWKLPLSDF